MISITSPKSRSTVSGSFHLRINIDFEPEGETLALYTYPHKSQVQPRLLRQVDASDKILVEFFPKGKHVLFVMASKDGEMVKSEHIVINSLGASERPTRTPASALGHDGETEEEPEEKEEDQCETCGLALGDCGCGGHKKHSSSEEESEEKAEDKCDTCHRPLKDCGCGGKSSKSPIPSGRHKKHQESSSSEESVPAGTRCDSCHRPLKDCGCGGRHKKHQDSSEEESGPTGKRCGGCHRPLKDCGCGGKGHHKKHLNGAAPKAALREANPCQKCGLLGDCGCGKKKPPPPQKLAEIDTEEQSDETSGQILIVHRSAKIPHQVSEIVVASDSEEKTILSLLPATLAYRSITITNFSEHQVQIIPQDPSVEIETFDGKWKELSQEAYTTVTIIPAGPHLWYLRE